MKEITKKWIEFVDKDLLLAKRNIDSKDFCELIAFHLQQALEKVLKAYIYEKTNKEPPRIHNLIGLVNLSGMELKNEEKDLLDDLNFVYTESRYPQSIDELRDFLDKIDLRELYNKTERLIQWIKIKL